MTEFTELMNNFRRADNGGWHVEVGSDWLQGRTVYGGLGAALCLNAALREHADLPPLRSAQFAFIGPASGPLTMTPAILRQGKSTVFMGVDLHGEAGLATRAMLCFGAGRASVLAYAAAPAPDVPPPENCDNFFRNAPPMLNFLTHLEGRAAGGSLPFSGASEPDLLLWLRHRDPALTPSIVSLLALADAPPPPALAMAPKPLGVISTVTWSIDMLTDDVTTRDGWWLECSTADKVGDGYCSQAMTVWNADGRAVMASRQSVAMFL